MLVRTGTARSLRDTDTISHGYLWNGIRESILQIGFLAFSKLSRQFQWLRTVQTRKWITSKPWQRILRAPYLVRAPYYSQSSAKGAALGRGLGKSGKARSINTFANHQTEVNHWSDNWLSVQYWIIRPVFWVLRNSDCVLFKWPLTLVHVKLLHLQMVLTFFFFVRKPVFDRYSTQPVAWLVRRAVDFSHIIPNALGLVVGIWKLETQLHYNGSRISNFFPELIHGSHAWPPGITDHAAAGDQTRVSWCS
jgi:hypothetical protein